MKSRTRKDMCVGCNLEVKELPSYMYFSKLTHSSLLVETKVFH